MNISKALRVYLPLGIFVFMIDRLTKWWALGLSDDLIINQFLSFHLAFNRGISWGLLSSDQTFLFSMVTISIILLTIILAWYAWDRYRQGYCIIGETLVLAGALSNICDRFYYQGVIDFIVLSYQDFCWPVFNCADAFIVCGVVLMFYTSLFEHKKN